MYVYRCTFQYMIMIEFWCSTLIHLLHGTWIHIYTYHLILIPSSQVSDPDDSHCQGGHDSTTNLQCKQKYARFLNWYCWWTKSCTTKDDDYPIIYRVLIISGGAWCLPSTVLFEIKLYPLWRDWIPIVPASHWKPGRINGRSRRFVGFFWGAWCFCVEISDLHKKSGTKDRDFCEMFNVFKWMMYMYTF